MVVNYTEFLILEEMNHWKNIYQQVNENESWEKLTNKIYSYIEKAAEKGDRFLGTVAYNIFKYFKANPKVLVFVIGILVAKHHFTKDEIVGMIPTDTTVSAEELYNQSMEGELPDTWFEEEKEESEDQTYVKYNKGISGGVKKFMQALADKESTNDADTINSLGYMGKYQFGEIALKDILKKLPGESNEEYESRIKNYWPRNFGKIKTEADFNFFKSKFSNKGTAFWPEHKQDLAMKQLLKNNKAYLGDYINKWVGKSKKGVKITLSGLLAGAHLLGPSNVKKFLDQGVVAKDGYGTPITEYIEKFGGYNISL